MVKVKFKFKLKESFQVPECTAYTFESTASTGKWKSFFYSNWSAADNECLEFRTRKVQGGPLVVHRVHAETIWHKRVCRVRDNSIIQYVECDNSMASLN